MKETKERKLKKTKEKSGKRKNGNWKKQESEETGKKSKKKQWLSE